MWLITKDVLEGKVEPKISSTDFDETRRSRLIYKFRLSDADDEIYFEGVSDDKSSEAAFAPLDDFAEAHSGCVTIEYLENGVWRPL